MRYIILLIFIFFASFAIGQTTAVSDKIIHVSLEDAFQNKPAKRKFLTFKKKYARYNPVTYVGAGLLYVYQNIISEQIQAECTYEISCSEYTKLSIQHSGFFIGALKGFNQLSECFDGARYEHPRLFIDSRNKIINSVANEVK
jgi:putative component of membrane protein insertase Oxa1/YidC/SpoIIIJ protein YidD